ncbi:hypothetical protein U1Q18_033281 [Sarracenia purpurea var. burkii]
MNREEEFDEFDAVPDYNYYSYYYRYPAVYNDPDHPLSYFKLRQIHKLELKEQELLMQIQELENELMEMKMQQELWMKMQREWYDNMAQRMIAAEHRTAVDYSRFTSFLEFDDSFLTPWNRKPESVAGEEGETKPEEPRSLDCNGGPKQHMSFEPGSFFSREVS